MYSLNRYKASSTWLDIGNPSTFLKAVDAGEIGTLLQNVAPDFHFLAAR
jgi:hypothetical protein